MKINYQQFIEKKKDLIDDKVNEIREHVSIIKSDKNRNKKYQEEMRAFRNWLVKEYYTENK